MKRIAPVAVIIAMLVFAACGDKSVNSTESTLTSANESTAESAGNIENGSEASASESETPMEAKTPNGYPIMTVEEFMSYVAPVELTTENWLDYIEIDHQKEEILDAFGEVNGVNDLYFWRIRADVVGQASKDTAFRIEDKKSNCKATMEAWYVRQFGTSDIWCENPSKRVFVADDYKCTKARGTIYVISIPEELWIDYSGVADNAYGDEYAKKNTSSLQTEKVLYVGTPKHFFIVLDQGFMTDGHQGVCIDSTPFDNFISMDEFLK